jgi:hypothetical protein
MIVSNAAKIPSPFVKFSMGCRPGIYSVFFLYGVLLIFDTMSIKFLFK